MTRRDFIRVSGGFCLLFLTNPVYAMGLLKNYGKESPLNGYLKNYFTNIESAAVIGRQYLDMAPPLERNLEVLSQRVFNMDIETAGKVMGSDPSGINHTINRAVDKDFETENVAIINGWVLSVTEARLCALVSLEFDG